MRRAVWIPSNVLPKILFPSLAVFCLLSFWSNMTLSLWLTSHLGASVLSHLLPLRLIRKSLCRISSVGWWFLLCIFVAAALAGWWFLLCTTFLAIALVQDAFFCATFVAIVLVGSIPLVQFFSCNSSCRFNSFCATFLARECGWQIQLLWVWNSWFLGSKNFINGVFWGVF